MGRHFLRTSKRNMQNENTIVIFPKARHDLEEIFEYVSNTLINYMAATKLIEEFEEAFQRISLFPEICPLIRNDNVDDKTLRKLLVDNYIVFYRVKNKEIQVVRVLHGMRNYEDIL